MRIICWWSGGVTSAVACKLAAELYGVDNCDFYFINTYNEHEDTYRFMKDCQRWYDSLIGSITNIGDKYKSIEDVWRRYNSLNVAHGAVCSSELKRNTRERFEKEWEKQGGWDHQVFGFDISESKRALSMKLNHAHTKPIFPLLMYGLSKQDCIDILLDEGIEPPVMYKEGYLNNNCFQTGCVQGGIGYWQKIQREYPEKFNKMADMEHELTDKKGSPVTMLKDQSVWGGVVFLKPHPDYPMIKDISMMKGRPPKPLMECNGFCGTNDLKPIKDDGVNFQLELF